MAITKFQPEIWSAGILGVLDKYLVYGAQGVCNRDYEGQISSQGDTVRIISVADPSIDDYDKDTDLTVEVLTDSDQTLLINQAKAFAFEIDDIDMRQVANGGALMAEANRRAAFKLRDAADQFVGKTMALGATPANALGVIDGTTAANVYDNLLVPAGVRLDEQNVGTEGRWIVLAPAAYAKLQLDSRFIKANESGTQALHNGVVGEAAGFRIYKSNNAIQGNRGTLTVTTTNSSKNLTAAAGTFTQADVGLAIAGTGIGASSNKIASVGADGSTAVTTVNQTASATVADVALSGGGQWAIAGSDIATTYAEQISKIEAFRPEKRFADALKGLHLYGAKVLRPEALVVASVKVA